MTGRSEFIEKYFEVVRDLHRRGFNVAMMDWRGQGLSGRALADRKIGHVDAFDDYKEDLRLFSETIAAETFPGPYLLTTHSMGGMPALHLMADGFDRFRAAILCAPMTRLKVSPALRIVAQTAAGLARGVGLGRRKVPGITDTSMDFDGNVLTSDPARHAIFRQLQLREPDAIIRDPTFDWIHAAQTAIDDLHRPGRFINLKTPVLIVSAGEDALVDTADHAVIASMSDKIRAETIDGALHEILMERDQYRDAFWQAFDDFVTPALEA